MLLIVVGRDVVRGEPHVDQPKKCARGFAAVLPAEAFAQQQRTRRMSQLLGNFSVPFDILVMGSTRHDVSARLAAVNATYMQRAVISRSLGNNLQFIDLFKFEVTNPRTFRSGLPQFATTTSPGETYYRFFGGVPSFSLRFPPTAADRNAEVKCVIRPGAADFTIGTDDTANDHDNNDKIITLSFVFGSFVMPSVAVEGGVIKLYEMGLPPRR